MRSGAPGRVTGGFIVGLAGALLLAGCGGGTDPAAGTAASGSSRTPPPASFTPLPVVGAAALDVGRYPTTPRPPLGPARDPAVGLGVDAHNMADHVLGPWAVDPAITTAYLDSAYVVVSADGLARFAPAQVAAAAAQHGLLDGFASARTQTGKVAMVNAVLRFPTPADATAAATAMNVGVTQAPIKGITPTVTTVPGHPETAAATYPFTPAGAPAPWTAVRAFTPRGPYVLTQYVQAAEGIGRANTLVGKAIEQQGPVIDGFRPAAPDALADVALDPTGLLARALPMPTDPASPQNAVYGPKGAQHFQTDPPASAQLFSDTGVTAVAMGTTNVYQASQPATALMIVKSFTGEVGGRGAGAPTVVPHLPESHCLALGKGFYCVAPAGRYAIEASGTDLTDLQQRVAAQYVLLTVP